VSRPNPPYYGAAYYPEDWPPEQIDADVELMKAAGMNCMRIAEFAWSSMEPNEGEYRFDWLHLVVEKLGAADIAVIMCTPTATPPIWLVERWPEVLFVTDEGKRIGHGARRHVCPNDLVYRDYCARIVAKMAEEFGQDDRIIGWQIDNEVSGVGPWPPRSCCCPTCVQLFRRRLRERYGTVEELNRRWCLALWSQEYRSFDQVPTPKREIWHHPSLLAEWSEFASDSYAEYITHQADILHRLTEHPVGTDMMPFSGVDYVASHRSLDLVQFNHYSEMDNLWRAAFWFDFIRPLKSAPFWNTETQTGWNGSVAINGGVKEPGWCRANSWLPIALGGEANLYWLWRQHWAGQELMHGAVVSSSGRPLYMWDEVKEIAAGLRAAEGFLGSTRPAASGLGLLWSQRVARGYQWQPIMPGFHYESALQDRVYHPMIRAQLRPDLITHDADLAAYSVIVCPFMATLDQGGLRQRLRAWIEAGGTSVVGPMTDIRNIDLAKYTHAPFGCLEEWTGVRCKQSLPGIPREFGLRWTADGRETTGSAWYDGFEAGGAEVLAEYTDGPNAGLAAVTRSKLGNGQVILLGTMPQPDHLTALLISLGAVPVADASPNLLVVPREGDTAGLVAVELEGRPATLTLPSPMRDVLSGDTRSGALALRPYAVVVLEAAP